MTYLYRGIQRRRPILESHSPYTWTGNTPAQEIRWEGRGEIIRQLLVLFDCEERICNQVFTSMEENDKMLFSRGVEYSKRLGFSSIKEFLAACTNGTIDESTIRVDWGNFEGPEFSKLLVSEGDIPSR